MDVAEKQVLRQTVKTVFFLAMAGILWPAWIVYCAAVITRSLIVMLAGSSNVVIAEKGSKAAGSTVVEPPPHAQAEGSAQTQNAAQVVLDAAAPLEALAQALDNPGTQPGAHSEGLASTSATSTSTQAASPRDSDSIGTHAEKSESSSPHSGGPRAFMKRVFQRGRKRSVSSSDEGMLSVAEESSGSGSGPSSPESAAGFPTKSSASSDAMHSKASPAQEPGNLNLVLPSDESSSSSDEDKENQLEESKSVTSKMKALMSPVLKLRKGRKAFSSNGAHSDGKEDRKTQESVGYSP